MGVGGDPGTAEFITAPGTIAEDRSRSSSADSPGGLDSFTDPEGRILGFTPVLT